MISQEDGNVLRIASVSAGNRNLCKVYAQCRARQSIEFFWRSDYAAICKLAYWVRESVKTAVSILHARASSGQVADPTASDAWPPLHSASDRIGVPSESSPVNLCKGPRASSVGRM